MPIFHFKKDATHGKTALTSESAGKADVPQGRIRDILIQLESGGQTYVHVRLELNGSPMFPFWDVDGEGFAELRNTSTRLKEYWPLPGKQNKLEAKVYNNHTTTEYEVHLWISVEEAKG